MPAALFFTAFRRVRRVSTFGARRLVGRGNRGGYLWGLEVRTNRAACRMLRHNPNTIVRLCRRDESAQPLFGQPPHRGAAEPLHQPRIELAQVQRARARRGRPGRCAALRTALLPLYLPDRPRRVLQSPHRSLGRPLAVGRRTRRKKQVCPSPSNLPPPARKSSVSPRSAPRCGTISVKPFNARPQPKSSPRINGARRTKPPPGRSSANKWPTPSPSFCSANIEATPSCATAKPTSPCSPDAAEMPRRKPAWASSPVPFPPCPDSSPCPGKAASRSQKRSSASAPPTPSRTAPCARQPSSD